MSTQKVMISKSGEKKPLVKGYILELHEKQEINYCHPMNAEKKTSSLTKGYDPKNFLLLLYKEN